MAKTLRKFCHMACVPHGCYKGISSKGVVVLEHPHKFTYVHVRNYYKDCMTVL